MDYKYFVYRSDSKINMLYEQYSSKVSEETETRCEVGVTPIKGERVIHTKNEVTQYDKVSMLERVLHKETGTIFNPNKFIVGEVSRCCTVNDVAIWADTFAENGAAYIVVLFGSRYNLLGNEQGGYDFSRSRVPDFIDTFIRYDKELELRQGIIASRKPNVESSCPLWEMIEKVVHICRYGDNPGREVQFCQKHTFFATVLHSEIIDKQYREDHLSTLKNHGEEDRLDYKLTIKDFPVVASGEPSISKYVYILASPIYVATEMYNPNVVIFNGSPRIVMNIEKVLKRNKKINNVLKTVKIVIKQLQDAGLRAEAEALEGQAREFIDQMKGEPANMSNGLLEIIQDYVIDSGK